MNFLQWNPNALNQETDAQYLIDAMRTGGAVSGIFSKETANKLFFQSSTMVTAIAQMMTNKGYTISDTVLADLITELTNILTKADFGTTAGTVCQGNDDRLISAGMKAWFWQNTAPTGWTIDVTAADAVIAVKGGTGSYNTTGGLQAGTWTHPTHTHTETAHTHTETAHTHTETAHTHTTAGHTLTIAEMPSHQHTLGLNTLSSYGTGSANAVSLSSGLITGASGGGGSHSHGDTGSSSGGNTGTGGGGTTGSSSGGNTGASATPNTWRPLANVGIICTKN